MKTAGRPRESRVTEALLTATLCELEDNGLERTTIAAIAARAGTSKQAVYRRYKDRTELIASAVDGALAAINPAPPQRGSVAADLRLCLTSIVTVFQKTSLGGAIRAIASSHHVPAFAKILAEAEADQRFALRQIFIATPFEADMETRIDLLLGLIYFRLVIRGEELAEEDVETAIYLVLGLVAPRDPVPNSGLPGM